jgi:UDP-galactopyranose mutase
MTERREALIVGTGLFGQVMALLPAKAGSRAVTLEKAPCIGGGKRPVQP